MISADNITHHVYKCYLEAKITHLLAEAPVMSFVNPNNHLNPHPVIATKVLIVDDDRDTTDLLKLILEPNDFEVIVANTGKLGIEMARTLSPDLMIVDLLMPDVDGLKVCNEVRQFSGIPILILSAVSKPNIAEEVLNSGADDFLVKPMNSGVLIASLNRLARRARAEHRAQLSNGQY